MPRHTLHGPTMGTRWSATCELPAESASPARHAALHAALAATVQQVDDGRIVLGHPIEPLVGRPSDPALLAMFSRIFTDLFGGAWDVQVVHATARPAAPAQQSRPAAAQQSKRQEFTRPSRVGQAADRRPPVDDGPPPPEPPPEPEEPWPVEPKPDEELTDAERDEMVATAHDGSPDARLDPDQVALELLKSELGARPVDDGTAPDGPHQDSTRQNGTRQNGTRAVLTRA